MELSAVIITVLTMFREVLTGFWNQVAVKFKIQSSEIREQSHIS